MTNSYVYITTTQINGTLYVGATGNLKNRVYHHRLENLNHFTNKHRVDRLVYYEIHLTPESAFAREKQLKKWNRSWKIKLIETKNPSWKDLYQDFC
ncbi:MAG: GIY-YIG nuclease family protein [Patescibacteria group bacterium]|jgi:putative endonuclease